MALTKLHVAILPAYLDKLRELAASAGFNADDYVSGLVTQHVISGGQQVTVKRPVGRPVTVIPDDVPAQVSRIPSGSGFEGVQKRGRLWQAKIGREVIGQFSSPELAATVRHFAMVAFQVGRGTFLQDIGMDEAMAKELAARVPYGAMPPSPFGPSAHVGPDPGRTQAPASTPADDQGNGPSAEPGIADGPREETAGGGAPTTSPGMLPEGAWESQAPAAPFQARSRRARELRPMPVRCTICGAATVGGSIRPGLCHACDDLYDDWQQGPAAGALDPTPPADGVYVSNPAGGPVGESFVAYVTRVRGLGDGSV